MASSSSVETTSHGDGAPDVGHGAHADVESHHGPTPVVVNGVSSEQEPSVEWGWHGHYPKVARVAGFVVAAVLLIMLWGNHVGRDEDIWLIVLAIGFASLSIGAIVRGRTSWRR